MYIAISFSQLEEAMRLEVQELLVVGRIAIQIHEAIGGERSMEEWGTLHKNTVLMLRAYYEIVNYCGNYSTACLILRRHLDKIHTRERNDYDSSSTNL